MQKGTHDIKIALWNGISCYLLTTDINPRCFSQSVKDVMQYIARGNTCRKFSGGIRAVSARDTSICFRRVVIRK